MSAYYERGERSVFPGAGVIIPSDLDINDCTQYASMQALVKAISCGGGGKYTTILNGIAYTEATTNELDGFCVI